MINIYNSKEKNFTHNGICSLDEKRELISGSTKRNLKDVVYEGTIVISKENDKWVEFKDDRILKIPVNNNGKTQLFRIIDISDDLSRIEVFFKHIFFDSKDYHIEDTNIVQKDGRGALNQLLRATIDNNNFTGSSNISIVNNCRLVDKSIEEALFEDDNSFINRWGGEVDFDNFNIIINDRIGRDKGYRIELRKNIKKLEYFISTSNVITKVKIKGYDGIELGEYLISPIADAYPHFKTKVIKYDDIKVVERAENPEEQEEGYLSIEEARKEMRKRGLLLFSEQNIDKPEVNFNIDIDEMRDQGLNVGILEDLEIGDTATLYLEDFLNSDIDLKQRCIELEWDIIRKINTNVVLGDSEFNILKQVIDTAKEIGKITENLEGNTWQELLDKSMDAATQLINSGIKDSYVVARKNEIVIGDNPKVELMKNCIIINKNGIGGSTQGYQPDRLEVAMTIDGKINASVITSGEFNGALIKAGTIEADSISVTAKKEITKDLFSRTEFDKAKEGLEREIKEVSDGLGDLDAYMEGAFKDGIVDEAEKKVLEQNIKQLEKEKADIDSRYEVLYNNTDLIGTSKVNLNNAKNSYNVAHQELIETINFTISDNEITESEVSEINRKMQTYKDRLKDLSKRFEYAVDSIAAKKSKDAEDNANKNTKTIETSLKTYADGIKMGVESYTGREYIKNGNFINEKSYWDISTSTTLIIDKNTQGIWANVYTSVVSGQELGITQEFEVDYKSTSTKYVFSAIIAGYSMSYPNYYIKLNQLNSAEEIVKTDIINGTFDNIGKQNFKKISKDIYLTTTTKKIKLFIGKPSNIDKVDYYLKDVSFSLEKNIVSQTEFQILDTKIASKVSEDDFSTLVEQNAHAVKIAWNNISNYVQFENGGLSIYNGSVTTSRKRAVFDEAGNHFWRDGYYLGKIGTNQYSGNSSLKGFVFDLESDGAYMTWAVEKAPTATSYSMVWSYANKTVGNYGYGKLHAGCDIDMHNYTLRNVNFEGGGINGTLTFTQIVSMNTNGTAARWYNNSKLVFKNGILIDATWGNG